MLISGSVSRFPGATTGADESDRVLTADGGSDGSQAVEPLANHCDYDNILISSLRFSPFATSHRS